MTAKSDARSLVKIRALAPILVTKGSDKTLIQAGELADVPEDEAKEFCDRVFVGNYSEGGEHGEQWAESRRQRLKRAERVH
jgi:hypothetical protein